MLMYADQRIRKSFCVYKCPNTGTAAQAAEKPAVLETPAARVVYRKTNKTSYTVLHSVRRCYTQLPFDLCALISTCCC